MKLPVVRGQGSVEERWRVDYIMRNAKCGVRNEVAGCQGSGVS